MPSRSFAARRKEAGQASLLLLSVVTLLLGLAVLGKTADVEKYRQLAASLKDEYNAKYLHTGDAGRAWYANNTQASNAVALDAGLVPPQHHEAVVDSLVQAVSAFGNRIGTGSVALGPLLRVLHAAGRDDLLYTLVTNPESPSYAFLVNSGYTTLREDLSGGGSFNHTASAR
jgi:Bacterial alpha-L-rhamnosidase 6 hairpin glycosidase domain